MLSSRFAWSDSSQSSTGKFPFENQTINSLCVQPRLASDSMPFPKCLYFQLRDPSYQNPEEILPAHHLHVYLNGSSGFRLVSVVKILFLHNYNQWTHLFKELFPPLLCINIFVPKETSTCVWDCLEAPYSNPSLYFSVFVLIRGRDYCSFIVNTAMRLSVVFSPTTR